MAKTIGLITSSAGGPLKSYENIVTSAVSALAREREYNLIIYSGGSPSHEKGGWAIRNFIFDLVSNKVVDGLFVLAASLSLYVDDEEFKRFLDRFRPLPMVSIGVIFPGMHGVIVDDRQLMREMTEHLVKVHGLHSPLYIGGPLVNIEAQDRLQGFREALAMNGIAANPQMILEGTFLRDSGYRLIREYLRTPNPPFDAVICANDEMAIGVREHLLEKGLHAPHDYILTGFDDIEAAALIDPPLTSVNQPIYEMARKACSFLCDNLDKGTPMQTVRYPLHLVIRESCGCVSRPPRIEDFLAKEDLQSDASLKELLLRSLPVLSEKDLVFVSEGFEQFCTVLSGGVKEGNYGHALDVLRALVHDCIRRKIDVSLWNNVLLLLESRSEFSQLIAPGFWRSAAFIVSEAAYTEVKRNLVMSQRLESDLRKISEELVNIYSVEDLRDNLDFLLTGLPLRSLQIFSFDRKQASFEYLSPLIRWESGKGAELCENRNLIRAKDIVDSASLDESCGVRIVEALTYRDEVLGVLLLEVDEVNGTICNALREMVGGTLKNIDLWNSTNERTRLLETLYQTEKNLAAWPDEMMAIEIVQRGIASWLHNHWSMVYLVQENKELLQPRLGLEKGIKIGSTGLRPIVLNEAIRTGTFSTGVYRGIRIPIVSQGRVGGLIEIGFPEEEHFIFDESVIKNLGLFVDQLALALSNAGLYRETIQSAEHIRKLNHDLALRLRKITSLRAIDVAITGTLADGEIYDVLLEQMQRELACDAVSLLLYNPESDVLLFAGSRGFLTDALRFTHLSMGKGMAGRAASERKQIFIEDVNATPDSLTRAPLLHAEGFRAYIAAPLISRGELKGVVELFHRSPLHPDSEWRDFLEVLTGQAAIALDHCSLIAGLQRANIELLAAYDATIEGWSRALDLRDHETEGHSKRVASMCEELGRTLGLGNEALLHLYRGALLHDIGKVAIPDSILLKPDKLTIEERRIMQKHPEYARELLSPIDFLKPVLSIPVDHHEKWDGSGYPRGLKGEEIPLYARIFALVDVWDALTSDRPYRCAWTNEKAAELINSLSGSHFDPAITPVFLKLRGFDFGSSN